MPQRPDAGPGTVRHVDLHPACDPVGYPVRGALPAASRVPGGAVATGRAAHNAAHRDAHRGGQAVALTAA
ncbi:hypothetical protein ACFVSN_16735 [Kitasatospora sp. NPDC057904]|uniref:hypothetical protein n=1 Tax=unclassified Kitasatospora TaxID=2633591 RepID=UPI0036D7DA5C